MDQSLPLPALTCGYRKVGIYICERLSPHGMPLEFFLPCPPQAVDLDEIGLAKSGVRILERPGHEGIFDVWDFVSEKDNPWPTDFLEQTRNLGTSRRVSKGITKDPNFKRLRRHPEDRRLSSHHVYVHAKAILGSYLPAFYEHRTGIKSCPSFIDDHDRSDTDEMCAALWWEMVEMFPKKAEERRHKVFLPRNWDRKDKNGNTKYPAPSCSYKADYMPPQVAQMPIFITGIILSLPLQKIEIPRDDSGDDLHSILADEVEKGDWQYEVEVTDE